MGLQYGVKAEDYDVTIVEDLATTSVEIKNLTTTGKLISFNSCQYRIKGLVCPRTPFPS